MTARPFKSLLHRLRSTSQKRKSAGFTLIELLVSMVIASIVTSGLMYLVVQLLENNQQDSVKTKNNQEMQSALDFISSELREAVYVYDGECLKGNGLPQTNAKYCPGIVNHIINNPDYSAPILAFWKLDPLPGVFKEPCKLDTAPAFCPVGRTYTLVVYYLRTNQETDTEKWLGKARITRYALPRFIDDGTTPTGYVSPDQTGVDFGIWPYRRNPGGTLLLLQTLKPAANPSNPAVLVDFVDDKTDAEVSCPTNYQQTPFTAPFGGVRSFYACVRNNSANFNQDTIVFLRGNASVKADNTNNTSSIQTQVLSRGVVDKEPK